MAKVTLEISAEGKLETEITDIKMLERLFRLGEGLGRGTFLEVPRNPHAGHFDLNAIVEVPEHMAHFDWRVSSLVITDTKNQHVVVYHQVMMTREEYHLLMSSFGFRGSCACDGATSDGCPLCNEEKTREWKDTLDRVKNSFK